MLTTVQVLTEAADQHQIRDLNYLKKDTVTVRPFRGFILIPLKLISQGLKDGTDMMAN